MGFNFRKSIKTGIGNINLSKSGVGYSFGAGGFRFTKRAGSGKKGKPGCFGSLLFCALFTLAIAFIATYGEYILLAAIIALAAFLVFLLVRFLLRRSSAEESLIAPEAKAADNVRAVPVSTAKEINKPAEKSISELLEEKFAEYQAELDAIPLAEVSVSEPAKKQLLKDMPDWGLSNITRSSRLDSIFPLVFIDVETTGLKPSSDEILEVSAIKFDKGMTPVAAFTTLCKPTKPIPETSTAIHHITDEMVADAPAFRQIAPALTEFLADSNLAGHNLDFDIRFIWAYGAKLPEGKRFYDTLDLAQLTISKGEVLNYKLDSLCDYYGIHRSRSHQSLSDAYATSKIFSHLVYDKTSRQLDAQAKAAET